MSEKQVNLQLREMALRKVVVERAEARQDLKEGKNDRAADLNEVLKRAKERKKRVRRQKLLIQNERVRKIENRYKMGEMGLKYEAAAESKVVGQRQRSRKKEKKVKEPKRVEVQAERARSPRQEMQDDAGQGALVQPSLKASVEKKESKR